MIDAMDDFFGDMDRNRKRMEYNRDVEKLELYLETVQQIINQFEEMLYALQSAHQQYTSEWSGTVRKILTRMLIMKSYRQLIVYMTFEMSYIVHCITKCQD
ncbi:hypothetical protein OC195_01885 [Priestia flexa]|nr:hypothetical protein OC195_01885 [Priestia flexa]